MPFAPHIPRHPIGALLAAGFIALMTVSGIGAAPPGAATVCNADVCVVEPDVVQTPLGPATVTVSATNAVSVAVAPAAPNTLVVGLPFTLPQTPGCPGGCGVPGCPGGCSRTSISLATTPGW